MGGPIITAGGLVFIGAAVDNFLRAFDVETGEELWKGELPARSPYRNNERTLGASWKKYFALPHST